MKLFIQNRKICYILAMLFVLSLTTNSAEAQKESSSSVESENTLRDFSKGTRIWSGNVYFNRYKSYSGTGQGNYQKDIGMFLGLDINYIRLLNPDWGIGWEGFFETFFAEKFRSARLIYVGAGPVFRRYIWQNKHIQTYAQANLLLGYDMALGESYGGSGNSEFRYRTGLRAGASYRLSNSAGVFFNVGPDWEGDDGGFDTKGIEFEVGIQLFRF